MRASADGLTIYDREGMRQIPIPRRRQTFCNFHAIDGMDPGEAPSRNFCLVALERAGQMPLDIGQIGQHRHFLDGFLNVVFAERPLSQRMGPANRFGRKRLAYRHQTNGVRVATDRRRSALDARQHSLPHLLVWPHNLMTPA